MESNRTDYKELVQELHDWAKTIRLEACVDGQLTYFNLGDNKDFIVIRAADAIETLLTERNILHAHVATDWLGDCHCSNCKRDIDYTSDYCNWCGAKLDEPEERE